MNGCIDEETKVPLEMDSGSGSSHEECEVDELTIGGMEEHLVRPDGCVSDAPADPEFFQMIEERASRLDAFLDDPAQPQTPSMVRDRILDAKIVLEYFKKIQNKRFERSQYADIFKNDLASYYEYSDYLINHLYYIFSVDDLVSFLDASRKERPMTIRCNLLKMPRAILQKKLEARGVELGQISWSSDGLVVYGTKVSIGSTPEYLAGYYMVQSAASFLPVLALEPLPEEKILDMCSAPGGKTTHIAAFMKNTGILVSNDLSENRCKATIANIHRLGVENIIVKCSDATTFPTVTKHFDRVLLDAPCSGTGIVSKDTSAASKTPEEIQKLSMVQKKLLLAAIDCTNAKSKTGGFIVYSTCSICVDENEGVVQYALEKRRNVKLVDTNLPFGSPGLTSYQRSRYSPSMTRTRRYYPHTHNLDGFFVAKFKKIANKYT